MKPEDQTDVTHVEILVAIEGIKGDINGLRGIMESHAVINNRTHHDHENRLRTAEKSIQAGRGVIGFLVMSVGALGAFGAWASSFLP